MGIKRRSTQQTRQLKSAPALTLAVARQPAVAPVAEDILDLTSEESLFELAIEPSELLGHLGAKLIGQLKEQAIGAGFTHFCYRDPVRPGIIWDVSLTNNQQGNRPTDIASLLPVRGKLEFCREVTDRIFPGFLDSIEIEVERAGGMDPDQTVLAQIPPLARGVKPFELVTALEFVIFRYPMMVRAWAALIFAYDEMLHLKDGADNVRTNCLNTCQHPQIVSYLLSDDLPNEA